MSSHLSLNLGQHFNLPFESSPLHLGLGLSKPDCQLHVGHGYLPERLDLGFFLGRELALFRSSADLSEVEDEVGISQWLRSPFGVRGIIAQGQVPEKL